MPTLLEIAGERDPVARWPWLRGVSLVARARGPGRARARATRSSTGSTSTRSPTSAPPCRRAATSARSSTAATSSPATSRSRTSTSPARELVDEPGVRALRHLERPVRDPQPRQRPRLRGARARTCSPGSTSARSAKYGPVDLPAYGPRAPLTAHARAAEHERRRTRARRTRGSARSPGSYLVVPASSRRPARFLYEGGLPRSLGGGSADPQGAADLARFFCELEAHG